MFRLKQFPTALGIITTIFIAINSSNAAALASSTFGAKSNLKKKKLDLAMWMLL
jgi:hypothetical protein